MPVLQIKALGLSLLLVMCKCAVGMKQLLHQPAGLRSPSSEAGLSHLGHWLAGSGRWAGSGRLVPDRSGTAVVSMTEAGTEDGDWARVKTLLLTSWKKLLSPDSDAHLSNNCWMYDKLSIDMALAMIMLLVCHLIKWWMLLRRMSVLPI